MAPVICDFDLMARLAAFTIDDKYELHEGDLSQPAIIVTPCQAENNLYDSTQEILKVRPRTPRPP